MKVTIDIKCENDAFEENAQLEVAYILQEVAKKVAHMDCLEETGIRLLDSNGNTVGHLVIAE